MWRDNLNDSSIDSTHYGVSVNGDETAVEGTNGLVLSGGLAAADAGIGFFKTNFSYASGFGMYKYKLKSTAGTVGPVIYALAVIQKSSEPAVEGAAAFNGRVRMYINQYTTNGDIALVFINSAGTYKYWNGSNWNTTYTGSDAENSITGNINQFYVYTIVYNSQGFKFIVYNGAETEELAHTDYVAWSDIKETTNNTSMYVCFGEPFTDYYYGQTITVDYMRYLDQTEELAYCNIADVNGPAEYKIGRAKSYAGDGKDWFFEPKDYVLRKAQVPTVGGNIPQHVHSAQVILEEGTYWLFVGVVYTNGHYEIWMFSSADGITFSEANSGVPVIPMGADPSDDFGGCWFPGVLKDFRASDNNKRWIMIYTAQATTASGLTIKCATAPAISGPWTKGSIVLSPGAAETWDDRFVNNFGFFYNVENSRYTICYLGQNETTRKWSVGYATSSTATGSYTKDESNPFFVGQNISTAITTLTSGSVTATVSDTSSFIAKQWVLLQASAGSTPGVWQSNRIESVDSSSQVTLTTPANQSFSGGKLKNPWYGSVAVQFPNRTSSNQWRATATTFQNYDSGNGEQGLEITACIEIGSDIKTFAYPDDISVPMAFHLGDLGTVENLRPLDIFLNFRTRYPLPSFKG